MTRLPGRIICRGAAKILLQNHVKHHFISDFYPQNHLELKSFESFVETEAELFKLFASSWSQSGNRYVICSCTKSHNYLLALRLCTTFRRREKSLASWRIKSGLSIIGSKHRLVLMISTTHISIKQQWDFFWSILRLCWIKYSNFFWIVNIFFGM